ncbi:hypothetical protein SAICODRAFT_25276 [Saitoella complicata NRRL Y-17804]|nr:uncharacterized protein SAICODRAFT_25276 [Saitoella complicata NRRL Y-17804]ODQ53183.1 hypothetical protein SAICODRAFT_25276 [Saitoella complicata NRRL Y-17804]
MSNTPIKPGVSVASSSSSPVPAKGKQRRRERKAPLRSKAQQSDDFTASLILPDKAVFSLTSQSLSINAYLSHLPSEFFPRFSALRILHLNGCGLKRLPPQIRELVELCYLDLTHNWLNMLPCQLHEMWTLEALKVDYHRMMRLDGPACLRITPENVKDGGLTNGAGPPRLTELASRSILRHIRPTDLEPSTFGELDIPPHLQPTQFPPEICAGCNTVIARVHPHHHRLQTRRIELKRRQFAVAPLLYTFCGALCMGRWETAYEKNEKIWK